MSVTASATPAQSAANLDTSRDSSARASDPTSRYEDLATPTSALIRATTPPDLTTLAAGDMVICADTWGIQDYATRAAAHGVHVRAGAYRHENEDLHPRRGQRTLTIGFPTEIPASDDSPPGRIITPTAVAASTDAFAATWDALSAPLAPPGQQYLPATDYVPDDFLPYLPYPTLNPAQAQAAPAALADRSVVVVAPTGAGKTVIGQIAALRSIMTTSSKAAWLVPQRSLTAELDLGLDAWRRAGLRVAVLAGGATIDTRDVAAAHLWVATTEKFESMCRSTSLRATIENIDTLIVDEIHLLGDPTRGPLLESLLARIVHTSGRTRIVGLSATAANAASVADWLDADLVEVTWRPTRHTTQILPVPDGNRARERAARARAAVNITRQVTRDGGSVLVFCGTKANVRATALAIAASRGANTTGVDRDDLDAVQTACAAAKVGLHYSDWPHKRAAEQGFRDRRLDVLVATSTLAAGVNTPARAVVVADTHIGPQPMEVSMIQQMFGRAGRAGAEREGWAFLLTAARETATWRRTISDGYTIRSGLRACLADHVLGEIVQGNLTSIDDLPTWWTSTLAYAQDPDDGGLLDRSVHTLLNAGFIELTGQVVTATALGELTSRMMIDVADATDLLDAARRTRLPRHAAAAEEDLAALIAAHVEALREAPDAPADQAPGLRALAQARGDITRVDRTPNRQQESTAPFPGMDASRVGVLTVSRSPQIFTGPEQMLLRRLRVTPSAFAAALYDAPRHLAWLAALGPLNAIPAWIPIVAADVGRRITWRALQPVRGDGRLLWACERLAGSTPEQVVPQIWGQALANGCVNIDDWPDTAPAAAVVDHAGYRHFLNDRCSGSGPRLSLIAPDDDAPAGQLWEPGEGAVVCAQFTPRGDALGTGWLGVYAHRSAHASTR